MPQKFFKGRGKFSNKKKSKNAQRGRLMQQMIHSHPFLWNFTDTVDVTGTSNAPAVQLMWGQAQNLSSNLGAGVVSAISNLGLLDGVLVEMLSGAITRQTSGETLTVTPVAPSFVIKSVKWQTVVTNHTTGKVLFWHYRCKARRDFGSSNSVNSGIQTVLTTGFTTVQAPNPAAATGVGDTLASTTYGTTPFDNPVFTRFNKVIRSKRYVIPPGGSIIISIKTSRPRLVHYRDYVQDTTTTAPDADGSTAVSKQLLKGGTYSVFMARGTVASDLSNDAGYRVGIGNVHLSLINNVRIDYGYIRPQARYGSVLPSVAGFTEGDCAYPLPIVANQPYSTINDGTGVRVLATSQPFTIVDADQYGPT